MSFTGQLGISNSQLGNIELGIGIITISFSVSEDGVFSESKSYSIADILQFSESAVIHETTNFIILISNNIVESAISNESNDYVISLIRNNTENFVGVETTARNSSFGVNTNDISILSEFSHVAISHEVIYTANDGAVISEQLIPNVDVINLYFTDSGVLKEIEQIVYGGPIKITLIATFNTGSNFTSTFASNTGTSFAQTIFNPTITFTAVFP